MISNSIAPYTPVHSVIYESLLLKEKKEFGIVRPFKIIHMEQDKKAQEIEVNEDTTGRIIKCMFSKDVLSLSCVNTSAFLLTHNCNSNFWNAYNNDIVQLNLHPEKCVFTCIINTKEKEMWNLIDDFISKLKNSTKTYKFQCSFISQSKENKQSVLLEPSFEIQVGNDSKDAVTSKWIFNEAFVPSFCQMDEKTIFGVKDSKIPVKISYFKLSNLPLTIAGNTTQEIIKGNTTQEIQNSTELNKLTTSLKERIKYIDSPEREKRKANKAKKMDDNAQANCSKFAGVLLITLLAISFIDKVVLSGNYL